MLFLDEAAIWLTQPNTATWRAVGQPMAVPTSKARGITARLNLMGCVDFARGEVRYREIEGNSRGEDVVAFLSTVALGATPEHPIMVILDQASIHTCRVVHKCRAQWKARGFSVTHLPIYSPELNPMEGAWRHLKYHDLSQRSYQDQPQLRAAVGDARWGTAI